MVVDLLDGLSFTPVVVLLVIVLVASVAAGSLLMIVVSLVLLALVGGLAYRALTIERNLDRDREESRSVLDSIDPTLEVRRTRDRVGFRAGEQPGRQTGTRLENSAVRRDDLRERFVRFDQPACRSREVQAPRWRGLHRGRA